MKSGTDTQSLRGRPLITLLTHISLPNTFVHDKMQNNWHSHQPQLFCVFSANWQMLACWHTKQTWWPAIPAEHQHFDIVIVGVLALLAFSSKLLCACAQAQYCIAQSPTHKHCTHIKKIHFSCAYVRIAVRHEGHWRRTRMQRLLYSCVSLLLKWNSDDNST